jgi:hypothetical protein
MKNLFTSLLFVLAFAASHLGQAQTIRRVNNTGVNPQGVNIYTTLQAAHDAASAGDIIYLEPSGISYGSLTCVRPLTIIGNGYFLAQNPGLQLDVRESIVDNIFFNAGSAGSRITGCTVQTSYLVINASNIVVERNQINASIYVGYHPLTGVSTSVNNALIRQNYMNGSVLLYPQAPQTVSSVIISNNIITGGISTGSSQYAQLNSILISNNVVGSLAGNNGAGIQVDNSVIKNNILTMTTGAGSSYFTPRNNAYSYNISGNTAFGTANGNQQNIAPTNIFVGGTASTDGAFQLRTGSPAIGTGESGTDVGAFGGVLPYRIAGIPNVPSIYQYNQAVSGNSLNATISTRSNN